LKTMKKDQGVKKKNLNKHQTSSFKDMESGQLQGPHNVSLLNN